MSSVFRLDSAFVSTYANKTAPFGFGGLGEFVYLRTYSRIKPDGDKERWFETVERVVNGIYTMQKRHIETHSLGWKEAKGQRSASEMYDRIFHMKFLPPGRGLFCAGAPVTEERGIYAALNNCAFVSTIDLAKDLSKPFVFLMDMSMLGVGVGFDCKGEGSIVIQEPDEMGAQVFVIPDSREGWVEALRRLIDSYFVPESVVQRFDYSLVRPAGLLIKGFGGTSSGPEPLRDLLERVRDILTLEIGKGISLTSIVDICNLVGRCVVAGNVRRCLPGNALVHTEDGLIPIKDVELGSQVLTSDGYRKVIDHFVQGKRKLLTIKTQDGEFRCTPNHRMAVLTGVDGSYVWKEAETLVEGDRMMSTRLSISGVKTSLPPWNYTYSKHSTTCKPITIPELDAPMAWFIGAFHGDGCAYANRKGNGFNAYVSLCFGLDEVDIVEKAAAQLQRFGAHLRVTVKRKGNEKAWVVLCTSKQLAWYIDENFKQSHAPIVIPDWILRATTEIKQAYIAGVIDSDGCVSNRPVNLVTTVYPDFARGLQNLLYSCGIESRLKLNTKYASQSENWQPKSFVHLITERSVTAVSGFPELMKKIEVGKRSQNAGGFPTAWLPSLPPAIRSKIGYNKQVNIDTYNRLVRDTDFCPVAVKEVVFDDKLAPEEDTYDICVEGNHEFYVNGMLSHNTAEISFGDYRSKEFINLKNYELNPQRQEYGWASNNSVLGDVGMDYKDIVPGIIANGEPGIVWLDNMRAYSRMNGTADYKDHKVMGSNPCVEQSLEPYELCTLCETMPYNHNTLADYKRTLKFAYLYAKTVTLGKTHWPETNRVLLRNRRIGCSMTGIAQFISKRGIETFREWCQEGYEIIDHYDKIYSNWLCVNPAIKRTSIKPSGSVSLLSGSTPGMHYPESRFYIRRVRLADDSDMIPGLLQAGYHIEKDTYSPDTSVVSFAVDCGEGIRVQKDVSMWEQLSLAAFLQEHWADNQVSCTITFDPVTEGPQIASALDYFQYKLKGISFLPRVKAGAYKQMPYEAITEEEYLKMASGLKELKLSDKADAVSERFCDGESCAMVMPKRA